MKILYVIDHLGGGGAEQQFVNIANNVKAEKLVYLAEKGGIREKDLNEKIPLKGKYGRRRPLKSIIELGSLIKTYRPDIVHAFLMYSCFITALAVRISKYKPVFVAEEFSSPADILEEVRFPGFKKLFLKHAYKKADAVLTVSKAVAADILNGGFIKDPSKIKVVYDGLDLKKYALLEDKEILRNRLSFLKDTFYICFVGSLVKRKGLEHLISAFKEIKNEGLKLLIIGDGPYRDVLLNMAKDPRIEFPGYRTDAALYIKASDLFVLPSLYEGLPNVIIEAMAVGTPVLATEVSGIPELIEHDINGYLVPPADEEALKKAIMELMENSALRNRYIGESLEKVRYFSLERMVGDYEKLYSRLMAETY